MPVNGEPTLVHEISTDGTRRRFRCDDCGATVLTRRPSPRPNEQLFACNGCGAVYSGQEPFTLLL